MNHSNILTILLVFLACCAVPADAAGGPARMETPPRHVAADSILFIYNRQIAANSSARLLARRIYLLHTTPLDTLIHEYMKRGSEAVSLDTISLHDYFDWDLNPNRPGEDRRDTVRYIYTIARKYHNKELKRLGDHYMNAFLMSNPDLLPGKRKRFEELIKEARRAGDRNMEIGTLLTLWQNAFHSSPGEHALASAYIMRLTEALDRTADDYYYKGVGYIWAGIHYYRFHEYEKACHYLEKGLSYRRPEHPLVGVYNYLRAWNHLANYYQRNGDLETAAHYHRIILESPEATIGMPAHLNFAICNLGKIEMQKGNYDDAIAMMQAGLANMTGDSHDLEFIVSVYTSLGECYLNKGDMPTAKACIDSARYRMPEFYPDGTYDRKKDLFALESKYRAHMGQIDTAVSLVDSALLYTQLYREATGEHILLRGEQMLEQAETEIREQRIAQQKKIIFLVLTLLIIIVSAMLVLVGYHRKVQRAYRSLAEKATQWANQPASSVRDEAPRPEVDADDEDCELAARAGRLMADEKPYKSSAFTIDTLAGMLGVSRNRLSRAINRTTGNNFNQYVNEYRIREAIRLLARENGKRLSMEHVIEMSGFNGRSSFYDAFRKITGLSPAEYRRQHATTK